MQPAVNGLAEVLGEIGPRVEEHLRDLFRTQRKQYTEITGDAGDAIDALEHAALNGGKRLRPALAYLAFRGAGGAADDPRLLDAATAVELLHTGFLVHDDVMDDAPTRRGRPTTHTTFAARHHDRGYAGETRRFAEGVATTVGDLAFFSGMELLSSADTETRRVFSEMAMDAGVGQYLDLVAAASPVSDGPSPEVVARYKTGRYTVEGPLRLGGALAGRLVELAPALHAYGHPVGLAYQLRDDLLGAFGDPAATGKPVGTDLLQGKRTLLLDYARRHAPPVGSPEERLLTAIGTGALLPDEVAAAQRLLTDLGARDHVESACRSLAAEAVDALESTDLEDSAKDGLREIADHVSGVRDAVHAAPGAPVDTY